MARCNTSTRTATNSAAGCGSSSCPTALSGRSSLGKEVGAGISTVRVAVHLAPRLAVRRHEALDVLRRRTLQHLLQRALWKPVAVAHGTSGVGRAFGQILW